MDILDYMAEQDPTAEDAVKAPSVYLNQKSYQDFVAKLTTARGVHDNPEDALNGQPYCVMTLEITEVNGLAVGSVKTGGGYVDVPLRVGDKVSSIVEMATVGVKQGVRNGNFRRLANIAAVLSGKRDGDFFVDGNPGPKGIADYLDNDEGKLVHVFSDTKNKAGWANPMLYPIE